ncbi:MAG: amino acid adenylation domain-containing protein [Anaerolineales bacterium]
MERNVPVFWQNDPAWNDTARDYPRQATLHALFENQARQFPAKIAAVCGGESLTYSELNRRANRLAAELRQRGIAPGQFVGIFLPRGFDLLAAQLAVLKAGGALACFDPRYPREALERICQTLPLTALLTRRAAQAAFPAENLPRLLLDEFSVPADFPAEDLAPLAAAADLAWVLFTSGSTGLPKAVLHTHRNLVARLTNNVSVSHFAPDSVFAQTSPISSIDALDEILIPLISGGQTAILPYETVTDPRLLLSALQRCAVSHILLVPSLLRVMLAAGASAQNLPALQTWLVGGEALAGALAQQFFEQFPAAALLNYYGLTEGDGCFQRVAPGAQPASLPIGRPVANTRLYLVDEALSPVAEGELGEIALAGEGLFREYFGRPDLNSTRWQLNPFEAADSGPYARLFLTGDLGRYRGGALEYAGRRDRMVKIRGFRVELGEVENVFLQHPAVGACVVADKPLNGQSRLVAYLTPRGDLAPSAEALLAYARESLADFAVPAAVLILPELPLSPNGKVDLAQLPDPAQAGAPRPRRAPRSALEKRLLEIWQELLQRPALGVDDNFFEVGGDSLAAIDLVLRIEKEFGKALPIAALMQAPTAAALAALLTADAPPQKWSSLVPIRPEGARPPLFCVHADGGVLFYYGFAKLMPPDLPIYGLQARGLADRREAPLKTVQEMAAHYLREIRSVQAHGPYHFCAFSAGGVVIFEMARQLRAAGEEVGLAALFDAYAPDYPQLLPGTSAAQYKLSVHRNTLRLHGFFGQVNYLWRRASKRLGKIFSAISSALLKFFHLPLPRLAHYNEIARLVDEAGSAFRPQPYAGEILLYRASIQPENIVPDESLGWGKYVSNLRIVDVEGTHNSIMKSPHLDALAARLLAELDALHGG